MSMGSAIQTPAATREETMIVSAARVLTNNDVCFVGIGAPSTACNLARLMHAPAITLIYESGTIGARPTTLPLSIGDGELSESALTTVSVPEMFRYWLQGSRITTGFLGGAQIDRFANLNTTVIGDYASPDVRLPGGGGAPEIAASCGKIFIIMKMSKRSFVERLPFVTSMGHGKGGADRERLGLKSLGPTHVFTDLCVMKPDPESRELTVASVHPGVSKEDVRAACGWDIRFSADVTETAAPRDEELSILRDMKERTAQAQES